MRLLPVRLMPGDDVRRALESVVAAHGCGAAFALSGIGSLGITRLRFAGADAAIALDGDVEILTLSGSIGTASSHLHMSVSDAGGQVLGGHVGYGCVVRTTAEVLIALLPDWRFSREPDSLTGYEELVVRRE
jgi:predicted DNA-binding protein with PD1-like motif